MAEVAHFHGHPVLQIRAGPLRLQVILRFQSVPTQTTTYTLTATGNNSCTAVSSATVTVTPTVAANAGLDQNNCNNGSFTLAGNPPSPGTGLWSVVSGTANITNPTSPTSGVTGVPAGTSATLRWTITSAPCSPPPDDVILTNNLPPNASGPTICQGASGNLTSSTTCPSPTLSQLYSPSANSTNQYSSSSNINWTNPGNVYSSNDSRASAALSTGTNSRYSYYLNTSGYGFSIPVGANINGITVEVERYADGNSVTDASVMLIKAGTRAGTAKNGTAWPTTEAYQTLGTNSDLWGTGWTAADINNNGFGVGNCCQ